MKNKLPTVTVGIPAYNEEANIGYLLDNLVNQDISNFQLVKILINSDGSTDNTNKIVRSKNLQNVELIENAETIGHPARQNEIFEKAESDIVVLLNADIQIDNKKFIEKLIMPVAKEGVDLTSCKIVENTPESLVERAVSISMKIKNEVFEAVKEGNNVYTCHGPARAFSKNLYKKIKFIEGPGEDAFSYLYCIKSGNKYKYVKDIYVNYSLSNNFTDYKRQNLRYLKAKENMKFYFGADFVKSQYELPLLKTVGIILKTAVKHPILCAGYLAIYLSSAVRYRYAEIPKAWESAKSSKTARKKHD